MTKFKFIKYKTNKKIRVIYKNLKSDIFVIFLHGLKSDLTGKKPNYLMKQCKKRKVGFMALEYSGHGKSMVNLKQEPLLVGLMMLNS